jgi:hypothetical protein
MKDPKSPICLKLTNEEALVLFDWISRFNEDDKNVLQDQAEQRVLWDIEAMLEEQLVEPLDENYDELLKSARDKVRDQED